jgi:hypothetical protein
MVSVLSCPMPLTNCPIAATVKFLPTVNSGAAFPVALFIAVFGITIVEPVAASIYTLEVGDTVLGSWSCKHTGGTYRKEELQQMIKGKWYSHGIQLLTKLWLGLLLKKNKL